MILVSIQIAGLLVYPLELGSPGVRDQCGKLARMYHSDECEFSWAFMLAIVSTAISVYCPILAKFSTYNHYDTESSSNLIHM